jgi:hypothetical protein
MRRSLSASCSFAAQRSVLKNPPCLHLFRDDTCLMLLLGHLMQRVAASPRKQLPMKNAKNIPKRVALNFSPML